MIDILKDTHLRKSWRRRKVVLSVVALLFCYATPKILELLRTPGAMLTSSNYTDRPISFFSVNDFGGGNLSAMGGGGIVCCRKIEGKSVRVAWTLGRTGDQLRKGVQKEDHELNVPLPHRARGDDYLHVRFLPGNAVELKWSPNLISPFDSEPSTTGP
jgi:hypothetical protein